MESIGYVCVFLVFLSVFLLFSSSSEASVLHRIDLDEESVLVNSSFVVGSEDPVGGTRITIGQEEDIDIVGVDSTVGDASYYYEDGRAVISVDSVLPRKEHDVQMMWRSRDGVSESFGGPMKFDVDLFGFEGKETTAVVQDSNILSWNEPLGFQSQYSDGSLKFRGHGHLWLCGHFSDLGEDTENYRYFGNYSFDGADDLVALVEYITGVSNPHERIPVVLLDDTTYDQEFSPWSDGTYETCGLVTIRKSLGKTDKLKTLLHETVHAFNSRALKWDNTETAYYDEGKAQFVEVLTSEAIGSPRSEVFGDVVYYEENGKRYRINPRSSSDELWDYYTEDDAWIKYWSPRRDEFRGMREFGYAFSELIVRNQVEKEGVGSLRDIYEKLWEIDRNIESADEKAKIMENLVDLRPCYSENRTEFENCLKDINSQRFNLSGIDLNHTVRDHRVEIEIGEDIIIGDSGSLVMFFEDLVRKVVDIFEGVSFWISRKL